MTPLLTIDAVREWVGDFEIGKGRPYSEGAAIAGCLCQGDTLRASVKGSRVRPYRVEVQTAHGAIAGAYCTCPVGSEGIGNSARCKHVAAVLLAYVESPSRFIHCDDILANLATREKPELIALVLQLLQRAPELEPLLAAPLPGIASATTAPPDFYFWQAMERIRGVNLANDWAEHEIAEELAELLATGDDFQTHAQQEQAQEVFAGVAAALAQELSPEQRERVLEKLPDALKRTIAPQATGNPIEPPF